jgi:hypothetical protein
MTVDLSPATVVTIYLTREVHLKLRLKLARELRRVDEARPFGAKGLGEAGTIPISAAVANAVKDAVGVRVTELPMTPERVYRAIRAARAHPGPGAT